MLDFGPLARVLEVFLLPPVTAPRAVNDDANQLANNDRADDDESNARGLGPQRLPERLFGVAQRGAALLAGHVKDLVAAVKAADALVVFIEAGGVALQFAGQLPDRKRFGNLKDGAVRVGNAGVAPVVNVATDRLDVHRARDLERVLRVVWNDNATSRDGEVRGDWLFARNAM